MRLPPATCQKRSLTPSQVPGGTERGNKSLASLRITKVDKSSATPHQVRLFDDGTQPDGPPHKGNGPRHRDPVALSRADITSLGSGAWMWQRPLLFRDTVEELLLPWVTYRSVSSPIGGECRRLRDCCLANAMQTGNEVIVDNDTNDEGRIYSQPLLPRKSEQHTGAPAGSRRIHLRPA